MEFGTIYCTVLPVSNPENPLLGAGRRLSLLAFYPRGAVGFPHRSPRGFTLPLQLSPQAAPERPSLGRLSGGSNFFFLNMVNITDDNYVTCELGGQVKREV